VKLLTSKNFLHVQVTLFIGFGVILIKVTGMGWGGEFEFGLWCG
jgi:hypothetical protein